MSFLKRSRPDAETSSAAEESVTARPGSKGRPTRTRREAEAARRRPLVPQDRKDAKRRDRDAAKIERNKAQVALVTGDEANMPYQHRGPQRRFVRDLVDTRHNVAEYFFPLALIIMVVALVLPLVVPSAATVMSTLMLAVLWGGILVCVVDALILRKRLRSRLTERFGEVGQGLVTYGLMRAVQIRRWRLPKAQIRHGESPRS